MSIRNKIIKDIQAAMKARDKVRLSTLRMLRADLTAKEIERRGESKEMNSDDEIAVLMSAAKRRQEASELFAKGGREELAAGEEEELLIIQEYLPAMMKPGEIEQTVDRIISAFGEVSPAVFGKVMPLVMKEVKGKADGKLAQEIVRKKLGLAQSSS